MSKLLGLRKRNLPGLVLSVALALLLALPANGAVQAANSAERALQFSAAAQEFGVPAPLLMAISYNQSRWENHDGEPSVAGGYGLMHLTAPFDQEDGRGKLAPLAVVEKTPPKATLDEAAQLTNTAPESVKQDDAQNIRAAAALLAKYAKQSNGGNLPATLDGWADAVTKVGAQSDSQTSQEFTDGVFETLKNGVAMVTSDGQALAIAPQQVSRQSSAQRPGSQNQAECPALLDCRYVPARYQQNNPNDPTDYGNYSLADRPDNMKIKYIVIHDIEGSYQSAIDWFQNPAAYVTAHYVIRSSDGQVTQMVKNKDVAWHAGNWYMNMHSIGIEHEGFAAEGGTWYADAMYRSSAKLVRYLAQKHDIPLDREHIVGHDQYHALTPERVAGMHYDPGPYWDWGRYMQLLHAPVTQTAAGTGDAITIAPDFADNQPPISECEGTTCTNLPTQSANFVYLRTQPNAAAPLLSDIALHPDGAPGTTNISDKSAKATFGQRYAVADRQGDWTAIWFSGQKGWFHNPRSFQDRNAVPTRSQFVTPKAGKASIPIYGAAYPEAAAYPSTIPRPTTVPLQYVIPSGQKYPLYDTSMPTDYFYDWTFDRSVPDDNSVVVGNEKFIGISYNNRQAYVKASDVRIGGGGL